MKAWRIDLNLCDWVYVLADDETDAVETAVSAFEAATGMSRNDDEFFDGGEGPSSTKREPSLDGDWLTLRQLMTYGRCVFPPEDDLASDELDKREQAIWLSTEY